MHLNYSFAIGDVNVKIIKIYNSSKRTSIENSYLVTGGQHPLSANKIFSGFLFILS